MVLVYDCFELAQVAAAGLLALTAGALVRQEAARKVWAGRRWKTESQKVPTSRKDSHWAACSS